MQGLTMYASLLLLTYRVSSEIIIFSLPARLHFSALSRPSYRRRRVVTSNPTGPSLNPLTRLDTGAWRGSIELTSLFYRSRFVDESKSERHTIEKFRNIRIIGNDFVPKISIKIFFEIF